VAETDPDFDLLSFVKRSTYRSQVVECLASQPMMPSEISDKTGSDIAHVSRALTDMREKEITQLLVNEDTKKGRIYNLTAEGEKVASYLGVDDESS